MTRNTLTTASELIPGNCFYKAGDKSKKVMVLLPDLICTPVEFFEKGKAAQKAEEIKSTQSVVYLRTIKID